jgi:hypothetical protein
MIKGQAENIDEWFQKRWGKFTASTNYKLLIGGAGSSMFGPGAMTYIKEKALEMCSSMNERPELDEVKSILWGNAHEYPAYEWYVNQTRNTSMIYLGQDNPLYLEYEPLAKESGGSPDIISITSDAKVNRGAEIKCPKTQMLHFDRLLWTSQWDILQHYPSCYCQIQNLLMITGADAWDFVSFDDRIRKYEKKGKIIEVKPDKKFQDNLDLRLRMAIKKKYEELEKRMN